MNRLELKYRKGYTEFSSFLKQLRKWGFNDSKLAELTGIERSMITKLRTKQHRKAGYDEGIAIMKIYHSVASGLEPKRKSLERLQSEHLAELNSETD